MDFEKAAAKLKERGNDHFKKNEIVEAIKCYQQAFEHHEDAFFKTNLALCYIKLKQYEKATEECKTAIKLSPKFVKAYYLLGECYLNCLNYEQAESAYLKAEVLAKELHNTSKSILLNIYKGVDRSRARRYEQNEQLRQSVVSELKKYVELMMDNYEKNGMVNSSIERENFNLKKFQLESFFEQNLHPHKETDVPDVLCCKITYTIMRDPVITTSGITYERSAIEKHLRENGSFDPVTRKPCTLSQLYPNLAVKEMVESWIEKHPYTITEDHYYIMD